MQPWENTKFNKSSTRSFKKRTKSAVSSIALSFLACSMIYGAVLHNVSKDILKRRKNQF